jgi:hypothetical protein
MAGRRQRAEYVMRGVSYLASCRIAGLDPAIPILRHGLAILSGMAGSSPAMTIHQRQDVPYCGGSEPRYELIAMMSSSERLATTGFISSAAFPALEPCLRSNNCRAM